MKNSAIEWTDHTFNPWIGCTKVSPGCAHCYAEALMDKRLDKVKWGKGQPRQRTSAANWKEVEKWNTEALDRIDDALHDFAEGKYMGPPRPRVFCASLADWLDPEVPIDWLVDLLDLIRRTPGLDWLLLTKRPELWHKRIAKAFLFACFKPNAEKLRAWLSEWHPDVNRTPPANVLIGASIEDQPTADARIPDLIKIPAKGRFLSFEPVLAEPNIAHWLAYRETLAGTNTLTNKPAIHWVIAGGESGPRARPMHPAWARLLRDQCAAAQVPFFFKQWGEWAPWSCTPGYAPRVHGCGRGPWPYGKGRFMNYDAAKKLFWESSIPQGPTILARLGKAASGRLLDGVEHSAFPA